MLGRNSLWAAGAVLAGLMLPSQAMAQYDAHVTTDLNLRVGPGTEYGVIDVIPGGYPVDVLGCLDAYEWCDIEWDGLRGWVFARYLVQPGTTVYLPQYAPRIGVPIITFSFGTYHDRYYRDRPWYRERHGRWSGRDWRDGDRDGRDRGDRDNDRDRDQARDRDRDRDRDRADQREQRQEAEQPRQQEREARPQRREREARPQRQEAEQPRQEREARPQRQKREARPQQDERKQRQGSRTERGQ